MFEICKNFFPSNKVDSLNNFDAITFNAASKNDGISDLQTL